MSNNITNVSHERLEKFAKSLDVVVKARATSILRITPDVKEIETRKVLDDLTPKLYMVMIFSTIFEITTPDNINHGPKLAIKKEYIKSIDRYIQIKQFDSMDLSTYRNALHDLLDLLDLPPDSNLEIIINKLTSICDSIETGHCDFLDCLCTAMGGCIEYMLELYDSNEIIHV